MYPSLSCLSSGVPETQPPSHLCPTSIFLASGGKSLSLRKSRPRLVFSVLLVLFSCWLDGYLVGFWFMFLVSPRSYLGLLFSFPLLLFSLQCLGHIETFLPQIIAHARFGPTNAPPGSTPYQHLFSLSSPFLGQTTRGVEGLARDLAPRCVPFLSRKRFYARCLDRRFCIIPR